jgi:UDP-N-acetylglucosamine 1-carboxyvinyltransferase
MSELKITGPTPLRGEVDAAGSKNASLPIMAAAILVDSPVRLQRVPLVDDVHTLSRVLGELGIDVSRRDDGDLLLETVDDQPVRARYELVSRMRASFCVLGPLLARRKKAVVALPGGCNIGDRPVDVHLRGLSALGARLKLQNGYIVAEADRLRGAKIDLGGSRGPTVTGTANVLSAAVLAEGTTTILAAATEPEIVDLGDFLTKCGAKIEGLGTPTICVTGVQRLRGVTHRVIPDRIEAATLLMAAAITGGSLTVGAIRPEHLDIVLIKLAEAGFVIEKGPDWVSIRAHGVPLPVEIIAEPYPGMATDIQPQWTALLSLAGGRSTVEDRVFPNRFMHLAELNRLGANVQRRNSSAMINGVGCLTGAIVEASDLRAAAALVIAALASRGETILRQSEHLDRGYQQLDQKLNSLGARIERYP